MTSPSAAAAQPTGEITQPDTPNNLPNLLTSFVGRKQEIEAINALLTSSRLVTLTGSGGCGKTRLSLRIAKDVLTDYPDGVFQVELDALTDPSLVSQAVASALDVKEQPNKSLMRTLTEHLKSRRMLLLLDNCEHLLTSCAQLSLSLLQASTELKILTTSRQLLGIEGEVTFNVLPFSIPASGQPSNAYSLSQYEAVELFMARARVRRPDFTLTEQNAPFLARICFLLDGIPLAIEMAAARMRVLSLEEIANRLEDRFRFLTSADPTVSPRQSTLRATVDWSYELLTEKEKLLFAGLSVFAGGGTPASVKFVCSDEGEMGLSLSHKEIPDLLSCLIDQSLVSQYQQLGLPRYRMLETVRLYATEKLQASEQIEEVKEKHLAYFLQLAHDGKAILMKPDHKIEHAGHLVDMQRMLKMLELNYANFLAALDWCTEKNAEAGLQLCSFLERFWISTGHLSEGWRLLERALQHPEAQSRTELRASALHSASQLAWVQQNFIRLGQYCQACLHISRELNYTFGIASSLGLLGVLASALGNHDQARQCHEESSSLFREIKDWWNVASALGNLSLLAYNQGDYAKMKELEEESMAISEKLGKKDGMASSLCNLGVVAIHERRYPDARDLFRKSLRIKLEIGDGPGVARALAGLSDVAFYLDDFTLATKLQQESMRLRRELEISQ